MEDDAQSSGTGDLPFGDAPTISQSLGELEEELKRLRTAAEHIEASKEAASKAAEAADGVKEATQDLTDATQRLIDRIDAVDFPQRLDEIEASIGETESLVQSEVEEMKEEALAQVDEVKTWVIGAIIATVLTALLIVVAILLG